MMTSRSLHLRHAKRIFRIVLECAIFVLVGKHITGPGRENTAAKPRPLAGWRAVRNWTVRAGLGAWLTMLAGPALSQPSQPKATCQPTAANTSASQAVAEANARRLPEALAAIDHGLSLNAACGADANSIIVARGSFALLLFRLNRLADADRIAADTVTLTPTSDQARQVRDRLLLARIEIAAAQGAVAALQERVDSFERVARGAGIADDVRAAAAHFRRCLATGILRFRCRDNETTILYGQYSGARKDGRLTVEGQCDVEPLVTQTAISSGGPFAFAAGPFRSLLRACQLEREIAPLAATWMDAVDAAVDGRADRARVADDVARPLRLKLIQLAESIDGFDQSPISRLQPRALSFFVAMTNARLRLHAKLPPDPTLQTIAAELRPLLEAAYPRVTAGELGFLQLDTPALIALVTAFQPGMADDVRAERIWRLVALSFGRETSQLTPSFAQTRKALHPDEMAVVTFAATDSTGVVIFARRDGRILFRELDPGAGLLTGVGGALLDSIGEPPPGGEDVPIGAARALYSRLICPGERALGKTERIAFFLDPVAERFPLTLLARPEQGCDQEFLGEAIFERTPRRNLEGVTWLGIERSLRIVPFGAVPATRASRTPGGYLGVAESAGGSSASAVRPMEERSTIDGLDPLPSAVAEIRTSSEAFDSPRRTILLDREAREAPVRDRLGRGGYRLVHFAAHAIDAPMGLGVPAIVLAEPTAPERARGADRFLTPDEVSRSHLGGSLVLLSACRTARPRVGLGRGIVSGLGGAFLEAGASAVIVTYWNVNDSSSAALTPAIVRAIATGADAQAAVHGAQVEYLRPTSGGRYPPRGDPYFWAPYITVTPNTVRPE